ncbi:MAG TPA: tetratricopeptide repeat protein [Roseiflexaceae bacterium]|nr:tetratricopeptide repeat protein [Roseiflexaceae bacterium]
MPTTLDTLSSYLPAAVARHHGGAPAPDSPSRRPLRAALLFADISGFTALTERLVQRGPAGVEELSRLLNTSFGQILDTIDAHGGDVIKFAGDALLAIWPVDEHSGPGTADQGQGADHKHTATGGDLAAATLRAAQCALAINARMSSFYRLIDSAQLTLRTGIAAGDVATVRIGGVFGRWEFLLSGDPLADVAAAEHLAQPSEVVLAPEAWDLVAGACSGTSILDHNLPRRQAGKVTRSAEVDLSPCQPVTLSPIYTRLDSIHTPLTPRPAPPPSLPGLDALLRSYIPGAVLSRLVAEQPTWLAELRRVTVIFAQLPIGDLAAQLEQAQAVMQALQTALYRFEGSVNKISLDDKGITLVAALGLPPLAHEDDPARGVQAAQAMRRALFDLGLPCAIGVASGRAFCGEIGSRLRREYTMIGDVVNLAARLMQAAASTKDEGPKTKERRSHEIEGYPSSLAVGPWSILCDEATARAAQPRVQFEALPPIVVKGKAEPVAIYQPIETPTIQAKIEYPVGVDPKSKVDLVGRVAEQALLAERIGALQRGEGGVTLIEAEAGMGKSRLIEAARDLAAGLRLGALLGEGDPMEQATPYFAWRGVFSKLLDLGAITSPEARRRRVLDLLANTDDLLPLAPLLNAVLPLELPESHATAQLSARARADATRDLLLRLLQRASELSPTLVILEDGHWLDSASWELALAASQRVRALMLLIGLRPLAGEQGRGGGPQIQLEIQQLFAAAALHVRLDALEPEQALALACRRLGVSALPAPAAELICEKAHGNPFFSEELAYALRDTGLIKIEGTDCQLTPGADLRALSFPDSVQAAIVSRVDRLAPTEQLTLKVASVIGRVFPVRTVAAVYPIATSSDELHHDFRRLALLDITQIDAYEPELAYSFKHAITQDVVYNLMLFAQRRQLHRATAEWYERTYASPENSGLRAEIEPPTTQSSALSPQSSPLAPFYQLLAHHWSQAGLAAKAIDYLHRAGRHALTISAMREARRLFAQALELLETDASPADRTGQPRAIELLRLLGDADRQLGDFAAARVALQRSLALARAADDRAAMIDALSLLGLVATDTGLYREAREHLEESLGLARAANDGARTAMVLSHLGNTTMRMASYAESEQAYQESLALFTAAGDRPGMALALNGLGNAAVDQRMYDTAEYCYAESLALRRALDDRWGIAGCLSNLGWVAHLQDDFATARTCYEESLALARTIGDRRGMAIVLTNLGFTAFALDDHPAARSAFDEALRLASEIGATPLALEVLVGLARLHASSGQPEYAAELLGLALRHPASNNDVRMQIELFIGEIAGLLALDQMNAALERGGTLQLEAVIAAQIQV